MSQNAFLHAKNPSGVWTELACDASGDLALSVVSTGHTTSVSFTRPSDTTAYTAGDAVGATGGSAILTFASMGKTTGGNVMIAGVDLEIDVASVPSGMTTFKLHLYNASPTAIADNAAWDLVAGDRAKYLGYVAIATPEDMGSTLWSQNAQVDKQVLLASGSLYAVLQTVGAYTPTSAAVKVVTIHTVEL